MTHPISARIKDALWAQLQLERSNNIKSNWLINEAITMYLEALDAVRESRINPDDAASTLDLFLARWRTRIVYTIYEKPK